MSYSRQMCLRVTRSGQVIDEYEEVVEDGGTGAWWDGESGQATALVLDYVGGSAGVVAEGLGLLVGVVCEGHDVIL